jgi:hypothetical protein
VYRHLYGSNALAYASMTVNLNGFHTPTRQHTCLHGSIPFATSIPSYLTAHVCRQACTAPTGWHTLARLQASCFPYAYALATCPHDSIPFEPSIPSYLAAHTCADAFARLYDAYALVCACMTANLDVFPTPTRWHTFPHLHTFLTFHTLHT